MARFPNRVAACPSLARRSEAPAVEFRSLTNRLKFPPEFTRKERTANNAFRGQSQSLTLTAPNARYLPDRATERGDCFNGCVIGRMRESTDGNGEAR